MLQRRIIVSTRRDPSLDFDFQKADAKDLGRIVDIGLDEFLKAEPHSVALGLNRQNMARVLEWIIAKSLHYGHSVAIVDKSTGKMAGFRLMSYSTRHESSDYSPFDLDVTKEFEGAQILINLLESLKHEIWTLRPEANKANKSNVLRREITFVAPRHQRKGIAQHLLHLYLDFDKLRESGVDGIQSEATSFANQSLLEKNGYTKLLETERKMSKWSDGRPLILPDDTKNMKLFYRSLRK